MKSLRIKLFSAISMFVIALSMLIIGVWAIGETQTITMNGNVTFNIVDDSLYIKDVKIKQDNNSEPASVSSFMPGYINGNFDMDLTNLDTNTLGSFNLYFYIINTSNNIYNATLSLTGDMVQQNVSVTLENSQIPATTLTDGESISQDTPESIILILQMSTTSETFIDLSDITINIDRQIITETISAISSNENFGTAKGGIVEVGSEITLIANFTGTSDADFLGWRANSTTGELVSTLPEYTFIYESGMPTTYYAVFEEANNDLAYYTANSEGKVGVSSCSAGVVDIIIPSIISREGSVYTVTTIGAQPQTRAQFGDGLFSDTLKTIVLPETLITIGIGVFKECNNLSSINLEDCVCLIEIGIQAFDGCSSLKEVTIPKSVESIKTYAFSNCSGLEKLTVESGNNVYHSEGNCIIETATNRLVFGCKNSIIPSYITSIGNAFWGCSGLTGELDLSNCTNLTSIGVSAFNGCSGLTSISLPSSLKAIEGSAFNNCINLTEVIIDSEYVYTNSTSTSACGSLFNNTSITTVKVLTSLVEAGENSYITTNFTKGPTEVIGEKNYTVYSK